jgi:hypothetical protein
MILFFRMDYPDWMDDAECLDTGDELFFGPDSPDGTPTGAELARLRSETSQRDLLAKTRYCSACPVRRDCAVLGWKEEFGIYGGWSPEQRQAMDKGEFRPTKIKARVSPKRDRAVALVREGLTIPEVAVKMEMTPSVVADHLRQHWSVITQSYGGSTA